ncbi:MAG: TRCF domain-containing protein, partial [Akkermansiaceae bacterium]
MQETTFKADFIISTETQWVYRDQMLESRDQKEKDSSNSPFTIHSSPFSQLPAFIPTSYLSDAKLRINAYRELAEANNPKAIDTLEINWID